MEAEAEAEAVEVEVALKLTASTSLIQRRLFSHFSTRAVGRADKASYRVACPQLKMFSTGIQKCNGAGSG